MMWPTAVGVALGTLAFALLFVLIERLARWLEEKP